MMAFYNFPSSVEEPEKDTTRLVPLPHCWTLIQKGFSMPFSLFFLWENQYDKWVKGYERVEKNQDKYKGSLLDDQKEFHVGMYTPILSMGCQYELVLLLYCQVMGNEAWEDHLAETSNAVGLNLCLALELGAWLQTCSQPSLPGACARDPPHHPPLSSQEQLGERELPGLPQLTWRAFLQCGFGCDCWVW